ncbi:hypothetical protein CLOM_g24109 [Closterium sp. NIES-68]|nr:hypothetical protein CLOM_g24109 [Closterium sp. NIES-68]
MWWIGLGDGKDYYTTGTGGGGGTSSSSSSSTSRRRLGQTYPERPASEAALPAAASPEAAAWVECAQLEAAELFTLASAQGLIHLQHSPQADFVRAQAAARGSTPRMRDVLGLCDATRIVPVTEHRIGRQLIVDEGVGMVYCYVQKAGCTSWKFWLREQHHHPFPKSFHSAHTAYFTNVTAVWYSLTEPDAIRALTRRDFTRFVFLRNPYTRPDDLGTRFWEQTFFGQLFYYSLWDAIRFRSGPGTARLRSVWETFRLQTGAVISFEEFVGLLGDAWEMEGRYHLDVHIVPQTLLCALDRIKYDFVGRFESMDEDVMTLMKRFGREPGDAFSFGKKLQKTKSKGRMREMFAKKETFDMVRHVYSLDMNNTLNGVVYEPPDELKEMYGSRV